MPTDHMNTPDAATQYPDTLEGNVRYLLDNCPFTVRERYKGLDENLVGSLAITFLGMKGDLVDVRRALGLAADAKSAAVLEEVKRLKARIEVAESGYHAAVRTAQWQASTNSELNKLQDQLAHYQQRECRRANWYISGEADSRAFEIADEAMYAKLRKDFYPIRDAEHRLRSISGTGIHCAKTLAEASPYTREAAEWLSSRGYVELSADDWGLFIRVVSEPGTSVCKTCNGNGVVGGHAQDGSHDDQPCPDCNSPAVREPGAA